MTILARSWNSGIKGRAALKGNYWRSVVVSALMFLFTTVASVLSRARSESILLICSNALEAGGCLFFRNNVEKGPAELALIREGFFDYAHVFVTLLLRDVFVVLWLCLGIFPGLIKTLYLELKKEH